MSRVDQLEWEHRFRVPAAVAGFAAGILLVAGTLVLLSIPEDRPRIDPRPDFLLSLNDSPGTLYLATALQAVAALCMIGVFLYLFRATIFRSPTIPAWFAALVILGPLMYAAAQPLSAATQVRAAEMFAEGAPIRGEAGDTRADDILQDETSGIAIGLGFAGTVSVAFLFVMVPLRARRAGLLSPFMGILGVIAGVLFVLPLLPGVPVLIQAFWLGGMGLLFLGKWPGGRGPAWETGDADPWPTPAQRRGLFSPPAKDGDDEPEEPRQDIQSGNGSPPPDAQPIPERPSSRKRKRRR